MRVYSRVLLPRWVFESKNEQEVKDNALEYMQRYPHYVVVRVEDDFALCTEGELNK